MGRCPNFESLVRFIPINISSTIYTELENLFKNQIHDVFILFKHIQFDPPILDRSCSIYYGIEDHFPNEESLYKIKNKIKYTFNQQDNNFEYNIFELESLIPSSFITFCLRTDGELLNIESFQSRGRVSSIQLFYQQSNGSSELLSEK